ncbi:MAG: DUF4129 domain-containing protein [Chloroflexi bacterium]|nr:DUF4129 domain-containing protein [Chloroflexota bacterium]
MTRWATPENLLLFSTFLLEGLWLYLWMAFLGHSGFLGWKETPLTLGSILLLLGAGYYASQALGQLRSDKGISPWVAGLLVAGLLAVVVRAENGGGYALLDPGWLGFARYNLTEALFTPMQATIAASVYLWWRGYSLAREGMSQEQVLHSFTLGLIGVILGLLVWEGAIKSGGLADAPRWQAAGVVIAFFFAALTGLALSHLMHVRAEMMRRDGAGAFFSQRWTLQLLGLVAAMLVAGWIAAAVFSFNVLTPVIALLGYASRLLSLLVYYLAYPVALAGAGIFYVVQWLIRRFGGRGEPPTITMPDFSAFRKAVTQGGGDLPLWVVLLKWAIVLVLLGLAVFVLTRLVQGRRRGVKAREALEEEHESLGGWREFLRDLLIGLIRLRWWFRNSGRALLRKIPVVGHAVGWDAPQGDLDVRPMYRHLLSGARHGGFPRPAAQTPNEYLATLRERMPEEGPALEEITSAYVAARYGEEETAVERKGALNRLWRGVYERLRRGQTN